MNEEALRLVLRELEHAGVTPEQEQMLERLEERRITPEKELPQMEFLFRLFHRPCFPRGELVAPWCRRSWNLRRPTGRSEMRRLGEALSRRPHHTTFSLVERSTYGAWRLHLGEDILKPENERENGFYV